jgi:putative transposase
MRDWGWNWWWGEFSRVFRPLIRRAGATRAETASNTELEADMSNYRRSIQSGGTFFFTVVAERRQRILTNPDIRAALREAIETTRQNQPFVIEGWVLLPDHLHAIWTLPPADKDFSNRWRTIKGGVTKACGDRYFRPELMSARRIAKDNGTLWQQRFWEHTIRDEKDFQSHLDYLHWNPVKHGLVRAVSEWPWSSFHRLVKRGIYARDWGGETLADDFRAGGEQ